MSSRPQALLTSGKQIRPVDRSSMSMVSMVLKTGERAARGKVWQGSSSLFSPNTRITLLGPRSVKFEAFRLSHAWRCRGVEKTSERLASDGTCAEGMHSNDWKIVISHWISKLASLFKKL